MHHKSLRKGKEAEKNLEKTVSSCQYKTGFMSVVAGTLYSTGFLGVS